MKKMTKIHWIDKVIELSSRMNLFVLMQFIEDNQRLRWNHSLGMLEVICIKHEPSERQISF